jgi:predicted AlkP superfamily phosphohydrolase/phosphomutase
MDAAESTLVRSLIERGELPTLGAVLEQGSWSRVTGPAAYSSGAVWPSFWSGRETCDTGLYGLWNWDPTTMGMKYSDPSGFPAFWEGLARDGQRVGVLDVPFAPFVGLTDGFEVAEWGPHDRVQGRVRVSPPELADVVAKEVPPHPFGHALARPPAEPERVPDFLAQCLAGVRQRGELALRLMTRTKPDVTVVVFPESHHGGHFLWHTVQPDLPMFADLPPVAFPEQTLMDVYREIDRQIGRLLEASGPDTTVLVFALHGMEPARGVPTLLEPLLDDLGLAVLADEAEGRRSAVSSLKARIPDPVRNLYRLAIPLSKRSQWGKAAVLPSYDWSRTRAFALPIEHEGQIRINLAGRETHGIVQPEEYADTCEQIEKALLALSTVDGRPVTKRVVRGPRGSHPGGVPDVIVHWDPAVFESPVDFRGGESVCMRREQSGQHALDGFLITNDARLSGADGETVAAEEVHQLISAAALPR